MLSAEEAPVGGDASEAFVQQHPWLLDTPVQPAAGLVLASPPKLASMSWADEFDDEATGSTTAKSSEGRDGTCSDTQSPRTMTTPHEGGRIFRLLCDFEAGNMLLSPNCMLKSSGLLRLWRSGRLRLLRGSTLAVFSNEGEEVGSFRMLRMDDDSTDDALGEGFAAGDEIIAPDEKSKVKFVSADELVVVGMSDNVLWSKDAVCSTNPCPGWRRLQTRAKKQLTAHGIDSAMWSTITHEEAAPTDMKALIKYALRRRRELAPQ